MIISKPPIRRGQSPVEYRAKLKSVLYYPALYLLEAIDEKSFYNLSNLADEIVAEGLKDNLNKSNPPLVWWRVAYSKGL